MEISVEKISMAGEDTGGGYMTLICRIFIDKTQHPRLQRKVLIHEVLEAHLSSTLEHNLIDNITESMNDTFDEFFPMED